MKKMFVLALVLGIAGFASAALSFEWTSLTTATLSSDDDLAYNAYIIIEQTGNAYTMEFTTNGNPNGDSTIGGIEDYADGYDWRFLEVKSFNVDNRLLPGAQLVVTISDEMIPTFVQLYDPTGYIPWSEPILLGIPEPMTLALLGLGGLFLRRRK